MKMIIATTTEGKLRELREFFSGINVELEGLHRFPGLVEPTETGDTFETNARIKACEYARQTGEWVLADDSGLEGPRRGPIGVGDGSGHPGSRRLGRQRRS